MDKQTFLFKAHMDTYPAKQYHLGKAQSKELDLQKEEYQYQCTSTENIHS